MLVIQFERDIKDSPRLSESTRQLLLYPYTVESKFYSFRDSWRRSTKNYKQDSDLVLAAIDEMAISQFGRWPWGRQVWAPIIEALSGFGAKVIAFDSIFSEEEKVCPNMQDPSTIMAESIEAAQKKGTKIIISYYLTTMHPDDDRISYKEIPDIMYNFLMDAQQDSAVGLTKSRIGHTTFPIETLAKMNPGIAYISNYDDPDGVFRNYPIVANINDLYFPSFSLLAYEYFTGIRPKLAVYSFGEGSLQFKNKKEMEINPRGETRIKWMGDRSHFKEVSLFDVVEVYKNINAKNDMAKNFAKIFKDKLVFIGSTASAAHDLRNTPIDGNMPGVFVHMNVTRMLLDQSFFQPKAHSLYISWGLLVLGILIILGISFKGHAIIDVVSVAALASAYLGLDYFYFNPKGYEISLFFVLFAVLGTYSWNTLINFYFANKDKKFLKSAFSSYISPELIDEMYNAKQAPRLGGDVGVRTAFFTDIQSFSSFSELLSATKLVELLNEYLTAMTDILLEGKGTLDKYEGDAIVAFFGAPMPLIDHASKACIVALRMQEKLMELRKKWVSEGDKWPQIVKEMRMRIGINSGEIMTGNMGSRDRMNYTMMGDSVNLAARLEAAAKQYGIFIQVSQYTKALSQNKFVMRELDTIRVVGKTEPITTYDLLGEEGKTSEDLIALQKLFHEGLESYKSQQWEKAKEKFSQSLEFEYKRYPDLKGKKTNPSLIYIERCNEFMKNPPGKDWDGVFTLTEK